MIALSVPTCTRLPSPFPASRCPVDVCEGDPVGGSGGDTVPPVPEGHCRLRAEPSTTWCCCSGCSSQEAAERLGNRSNTDQLTALLLGKATSGRRWGDWGQCGSRGQEATGRAQSRAFAAHNRLRPVPLGRFCSFLGRGNGLDERYEDMK